MRTFFALLSAQIRGQAKNRASFLLDVITTALLPLAGFGIIASALARFNGIAGWSVMEIVFLYGMVESSFGLMDMLFSGFDPDWFGGLVRRGLLDQFLLRPVNLFAQVLTSAFLLRRLGRISQGLIALGIAIGALHIHWTAGKLAYLPLVIAGQVLCYGALFVTGSVITFWTGQPLEAINILTYGGTEMTTYPMSIYPTWIRSFFSFVVPTIFMNYYPALFFLDKPDPLGLPWFASYIAPLVGAGMLAAAVAFWRVGMRRYQGAGT